MQKEKKAKKTPFLFNLVDINGKEITKKMHSVLISAMFRRYGLLLTFNLIYIYILYVYLKISLHV